jgi:starvation-inducible DNA-binding protein
MTMNLNIGITQRNRDRSIEIISVLLADEVVLTIKTHNYHWNITGPRFYSLHIFLKKQCDKLDEIVDRLAEKIRTLGGRAPGTLKEFLNKTRLEEDHGRPDAPTMLSSLLSDHEQMIVFLRQGLEECHQNHNAGTADFLTRLMEKHETMAWKLRSYLE